MIYSLNYQGYTLQTLEKVNSLKYVFSLSAEVTLQLPCFLELVALDHSLCPPNESRYKLNYAFIMS